MKTRYFLYRAFFIILLTLGLILAFNQFSADIIKLRSLSIHRKILIFPLFISQIVIWCSLSYGWKTSLRLMGRHAINSIDAFSHVTLMSASKYIPGKVWGYVARHQLLVGRGVDHPTAASVTLWDSTGILVSGTVVGILLCIEIIYKNLVHIWFMYAIIIFILIIINLPLILSLIPLHPQIILRIGISNINVRSTYFWQISFTYILAWLIVGGSYCLVGAMILPELPSVAEAFTIGGACCLGVIAGFLAFFAPGGIGVREALSTSIMAAVIPLDQALAIAICFRIWTTFTDLLGGVLALMCCRFASCGKK